MVRRILSGIVRQLGPAQRILSLCAGDGRDIVPVLVERPPEQRPKLVLVELDPELAAAAQQRVAEADVSATVVVGDAGLSVTWRKHLPVDLLMLCGIFGNVPDADIQQTISTAPAMLARSGLVIWTRGALRERDLRPQVRQWFGDAGFDEVAYEGEPGGYGVGVNRHTDPMAIEPLPPRLFAFNR